NGSEVSRLSVAIQSAIVGFASYLAWFSLMRKYMASQLGVLSFMTPVFGVITAVFFLREQLQSGFILGTILILSGISIVSGWSWFRSRLLTVFVKK
ncbi:EamA family transporter, partial [Salmonella enterica]|nr:EamA family transporter [Salmonella enterica]EJF6030325.1 EamA family transporter [Salmonella enterica]EJF6191777.1 EamA family transporter [Salmonella enterica]EJX1962664.1 EamA family transporter [Salmonella enterica]